MQLYPISGVFLPSEQLPTLPAQWLDIEEALMTLVPGLVESTSSVSPSIFSSFESSILMAST